MNFLPTHKQMLVLVVLMIAALAVSLMPHSGSPEFRYTGSDPEHTVWNLGWPLATCIYDAAHAPHFFPRPLAYLIGLAQLGGILMIYVLCVARNHFGTPRSAANVDTVI